MHVTIESTESYRLISVQRYLGAPERKYATIRPTFDGRYQVTRSLTGMTPEVDIFQTIQLASLYAAAWTYNALTGKQFPEAATVSTLLGS